MKIIGIGDNVVDVYVDKNTFYPGGNCVNVVVNAKRNGALKSAYLGIFGTDEAAKHIKNSLKLENIEYDYSRVLEGKSGQPRVDFNEEGDRIFVGSPKDTVQHMVKIRLTQNDLEYIKTFDVAHVSCYSSMEEELDKLSKVIPISFDFSTSVSYDYLSKVCPYIDYAFLSGADLTDKEIEELLKEVKKYKIKVVGITRGSRPALFIHDGDKYIQPSMKTKVLDTMGAGDSFIGAFLKAYIDGETMKSALQLGVSSATKTCTFHGGFGHPMKMTPNC